MMTVARTAIGLKRGATIFAAGRGGSPAGLAPAAGVDADRPVRGARPTAISVDVGGRHTTTRVAL